MYAIIATGGKQYKVAEGDIIKVEKLGVEAGETFTFDIVSHLTSPPVLYCASYDCSGIFIALHKIIAHISSTSIFFHHFPRYYLLTSVC